jgi:hypothetical protein
MALLLMMIQVSHQDTFLCRFLLFRSQHHASVDAAAEQVGEPLVFARGMDNA